MAGGNSDFKFNEGAVEKWGSTLFNGGGTGPFNIPHTLGDTPDFITVMPASAGAASASFYVSGVDATNITVSYFAATTSGTNNITLRWHVGRRDNIRALMRAKERDMYEDD